MKTYKHLYEKYISDENILQALYDCRGDKRSHRQIDIMIENSDYWIPIIREWAKNFHNAKHEVKTIYDGVSRKQREIIVPTDKEQIIHHMLMNVFKPIVMQGFYEHSYGSIDERGAEKCKYYLERDIRRRNKVKYFLKMDIRKYYNTIDTQILIQKLRKIIKDERYLSVLEEVINVQSIGLPLGFYTSQLLAQFYLKDLDRYIKEVLDAKYYYRYVDDMVIHDNNKRKLHSICDAIRVYLKIELHLEMKNNYQVFRFDYIDKNGKRHGRDLDFLGYRFYYDRTVLRKSVMLKATRKAIRISKKSKFTVYDARQMLAYMSKIDNSDTYGAYLTWIKPCVKIKRCKRKISAFDRKRNEERKNYVVFNRIKCET